MYSIGIPKSETLLDPSISDKGYQTVPNFFVQSFFTDIFFTYSYKQNLVLDSCCFCMYTHVIDHRWKVPGTMWLHILSLLLGVGILLSFLESRLSVLKLTPMKSPGEV
jgi:hypothetical protein